MHCLIRHVHERLMKMQQSTTTPFPCCISSGTNHYFNFHQTRKFPDILADTVQLLWFKRFLSDHDAITPLKFWQDVERMKTQSKDSRARQTKARVIVKQYFANTDDPSKTFTCTFKS